MAGTASPDVRVRLSAEGVAEVIAALNKVGSAANAAGRQGAAGISVLNGTIAGLTRAMAPLLAAFSAVSVFNFGVNAAKWSDELMRFTQILGISANDLRAFLSIATKSDVSVDTLRRGLVRFVEGVAQARSGNGDFAASFKTLGINIAEFQGLGTAEQLALLGKRMSDIADGTEKTTAFVRIFGNRASLLIPLLNDIGGEGGLEGIRKKAERLGLVFSEDLTNATADVWNEMGVLNIQLKTMASRFIGGFAPELTQALKAMQTDVGDNASKWEEWGRRIAKPIKDAVIDFTTFVDTVSTGFDILNTVARGGDEEFWRKDTEKKKKNWENLISWMERNHPGETATKLLKKGFGQTFSEALTPKGFDPMASFDESTWQGKLGALKRRTAERQRVKDEQPGPSTSKRGEREAELQDQALALQAIREAAASNEVKLAQLTADKMLDVYRAEYERGLISVTEYYEKRAEAIEKGRAAEVKSLKERGDQEALKLSFKDREVATAKTATDIEIANAKAAQDQARNASELEKERAGIKRLMIESERDLLELEGNSYEAERVRIKQKLEDLTILFAKTAEFQKLPGEDISTFVDRKVGAAEKILNAAALNRELQRETTNSFADLGDATSDIQAQINAGILSELEGRSQILAIQKDMVAQLRAQADLAAVAAERTGDEDEIRKAEDMQRKVKEVELQIRSTDDILGKLRDTSAVGLGDAITEGLTDGIRSAGSFAAAMAHMAFSVIDSIQRMIANFIALRIVTSAFGAIFGGGWSAKSVTLAGAGDFATAAEGGQIVGPGTGTSDSILTWLSNREFVTRSAVVTQPGALSFLQTFNKLGMRALAPHRFSEGGLIGASSVANGGGFSAPGGQLDIGGNVTVGLEDGLVARNIESRAGEKAVLRVLEKNQKMVRRIIG